MTGKKEKENKSESQTSDLIETSLSMKSRLDKALLSPSLIKNERGSLIIAIILCMALTVGTIFALLYRTDDSVLYRRVMLWRGGARTYLSNVQTAFESPVSIAKMMTDPLNNPSGGASLNRCLNDPTYNCPAGAHPLALFAEDGTPIVNPSVVTLGAMANGQMCNQFGTQGCLLRLNVTWTPVCPAAGICNLQQIAIKATFETQGLDANLSRTVNIATKDLDMTFNFTP